VPASGSNWAPVSVKPWRATTGCPVPKLRTNNSTRWGSALIFDRNLYGHSSIGGDTEAERDGEDQESNEILLHERIVLRRVGSGPAFHGYSLGVNDLDVCTLRSVTSSPHRHRGWYRVLAWSVLAFNVLVVLGGSVVRATGSGDGCGASWPKCTGRIFPVNPAVETVIEFTHRLMSGLAIVGVVALFIFAIRLYGRGHRVRRAARASLVLLLVESLLGASLVIFGWVAQDASIGRMIVVPLHLTNTYLLLGALASTAWWSSGNPGPVSPADLRTVRRLSIGAIGLLVVGAMGALNALGDTLYPAASFFSGVSDEFSGDAPWLVQVRVIHPVVAVAVGFGVAYLVMRVAAVSVDGTKRIGAVVGGLIVLQIFVGLANVMLAAPLETQVVHLAIADTMWIAYVLFVTSRLGEREVSEPAMETAA